MLQRMSLPDHLPVWRRPSRRAACLGAAAAVFVTLAGCESPSFEDSFEGQAVDTKKWLMDADHLCTLKPSTRQAAVGKQSLLIEAPSGLRCEIVPRLHSTLMAKFRREPFGEERWYRFSVFIEDIGDQTPTDDRGRNTIVAQWHSSPDSLPRKESGRGPPLALRIHNGRWGITYGSDPSFRSTAKYLANDWHLLGPVETGRWIDWTFRVVWSYKEDGITQIWRDSDLVMDRAGANTFNDLRGVYLKLGLYHPTGDQVIYLDNVSIRNSE